MRPSAPARLRRSACAALLPLMLAACSVKVPGLGGQSPSSGSSAGAAAPHADVPASIGEVGVRSNKGNGLGSGSVFDAATVRAALLGFDVNERLLETDSGLERVIMASYAGDPAAEIYPDAAGERVARIDVVGKAIAGPDGLRIGSALHLQPRKGFGCAPGGPEGLHGHVLCARAGDDRLTYVYDHGVLDAAGALPPADLLVRARLVRMIWTAEQG